MYIESKKSLYFKILWCFNIIGDGFGSPKKIIWKIKASKRWTTSAVYHCATENWLQYIN